MIPLGTDRALRQRTVVTWLLIGLSVAGFAAQIATGWLVEDGPEPAAARFVLRPVGFEWWMLFSHQFLHGDWWHLLGNMLFLWVFGPNIEDRFGRLGFPVFYLLAGAAAGGLHVLMSDAGAIGASGAIAGCTGAYLIMFPRTLIRVFSLLVVVGVIMVPAWWFIGLSVVWDIVAQSSGQRTGVAHMAHLGGYAFGAGVSFALLATKVLPREPYDVFSMARQAYRRRQIRSAAVGQQRDMERRWQSARDEATPSGTGNARSDRRNRGHASAPGPRNARRSATNGTAARSDAGPPDAPPEVAALAAARAEIARLLASGDVVAAADAYKKLAEQHPARPPAERSDHGAMPAANGSGGGPTTLSRRLQYELANHFFSTGDHAAAVYAYERFLEAYPRDPEAPQIRLLLGRISARYMNDPIRAKALLTEAMAGLRDEDTREMARRELEALG